MDKALIVAISKYGGLKADPLPGAANALLGWKALLVGHYKFIATTGGNLHSIENATATKGNILVELQWLATGATASDRLIVIFVGHGSHVNRLDPKFGVMVDEQCLITYPRPFDKLDDVPLFGDEIVKAIGKTPASLLVVVDSCHASGVFDDVLLQPLSINAAEDPLIDFVEGLRVVTFKQRLTAAIQAFTPETLAKQVKTSIVVLSAAQELESAYEGEIDGKRQMLFSYHAIAALNLNDQYKYRALRSAILPKLRPHQTPDLDGDASRHSNAFTY